MQRILLAAKLLRRWGRHLPASLGVAAILFLSGARWSQGSKVLEAESIFLRDKAGHTRCIIGVAESGASTIHFVGRDGKTRLYLGLREDDTPIVSLVSQTGGVRLAMRLSKDGTPDINFADETSMPRQRLGLGADGHPFLVLSSKDGQSRMGAWEGGDFLSGLYLSGRDGKSGLVLGILPENSPAILLIDRQRGMFQKIPETRPADVMRQEEIAQHD
jgi:hypothetical protein